MPLFFGGTEMIYFIQAGENGPIKIGESDHPEERLRQLQIANPYELKLLWVYDDDESEWNEAKIQALFDHELIRGEWFRPSRNLFRFIKDEMVNAKYIEFINSDFVIDIREKYPGTLQIYGHGFDIKQDISGKSAVCADGPHFLRVLGVELVIEDKRYPMPKSGIKVK